MSPDGLRIVFESNRAKWGGTDLWLVGVAGGELARLTDTPVGTYHRSADWAPDGERIVCEANREEAARRFAADACLERFAAVYGRARA